jgi:hypothetical protein
MRLPLLAVAILSALCLSMSVLASTAAAFVEEAPGPVKVGIQTREVARYWEGTRKWSGLTSGASGATPCQAPWLSPCAASTFHEYRYGGTYDVTLTAKDVGGNEASVTNPVVVDGPAPPSPNTGGSGSTPATTGSGSTSGPNVGSKLSPAKVVATQAVISHSLSSVLKGGLVIRYSVSEQVAGRFEVLLAGSIAHKLGLKGASAAGLAKGTPAQTIIAKAILVTTKGGRGTYKIRFSKATASRLRKLPKVSLMIRMVVHNAAGPAVTTVLDTVNLAR